MSAEHPPSWAARQVMPCQGPADFLHFFLDVPLALCYNMDR